MHIRTKKAWEEHKLIMKRYLNTNQWNIVKTAIEFTEYLMKRNSEMQTQLNKIQNIELIKNQKLSEQQESLEKRKAEKYRAIILSMRAQGIEGSKEWELAVKSMGFRLDEARGVK
jgi:hypothetical protein